MTAAAGVLGRFWRIPARPCECDRAHPAFPAWRAANLPLGVSRVCPPLGLVPVIGTPTALTDTGRGSSGAVSAPVVGVIGGGQLARMMQPAAIALGVRLRVLATGPDESAAQVIPDVALGAHDDPQAVLAFARSCDVITFDHEHVPTPVLERLIELGVAVRPGPGALVHAQDKSIMRERLSAIGVPCPQWAHLD